MRKQIKGFEDYWIDTGGRVWSTKFGKVKELKAFNNGYGYLRVDLLKNGKAKTMKVHRLVAMTFLDNPEKYEQVNHKNGIKTDNRLENLEWCSASQNMKHAYQNKLKNAMKGSANYRTKLSDAQVIEIFMRLDNGESPTEIAKDYPTTRHAIYLMKAGRSWSHLRY